MSWQLRAAVKGDLRKALELDRKASAGAVTSVIRRQTRVLRNRVRRQIRSAGLGERLGKVVRDSVDPTRGVSINAKGKVFDSPLKRKTGPVYLIDVFVRGATVRAVRGKFLALQIGIGVQLNQRKRAQALHIDPESMSMIPLRSGKGYLVVRRSSGRSSRDRSGNYGEPVLLLLREVRIRGGRLNPESELERTSANLAELVAREWDRRASKSGIAE